MNEPAETKTNEEKETSVKIFWLQWQYNYSYLHNSILFPANMKKNVLS